MVDECLQASHSLLANPEQVWVLDCWYGSSRLKENVTEKHFLCCTTHREKATRHKLFESMRWGLCSFQLFGPEDCLVNGDPCGKSQVLQEFFDLAHYFRHTKIGHVGCLQHKNLSRMTLFRHCAAIFGRGLMCSAKPQINNKLYLPWSIKKGKCDNKGCTIERNGQSSQAKGTEWYQE